MDKHWAVLVLKDIQDALDQDRYDAATYHINDAINAILASDAQPLSGAGFAAPSERKWCENP